MICCNCFFAIIRCLVRPKVTVIITSEAQALLPEFTVILGLRIITNKKEPSRTAQADFLSLMIPLLDLWYAHVLSHRSARRAFPL